MLIELIVAGMMSCSIYGQSITEKGDRQCRYRCQDGSIEFATTNPQYSCPNVLHVEKPKKEPKWKQRLNKSS